MFFTTDKETDEQTSLSKDDANNVRILYTTPPYYLRDGAFGKIDSPFSGAQVELLDELPPIPKEKFDRFCIVLLVFIFSVMQACFFKNSTKYNYPGPRNPRKQKKTIDLL